MKDVDNVFEILSISKYSLILHHIHSDAPQSHITDHLGPQRSLKEAVLGKLQNPASSQNLLFGEHGLWSLPFRCVCQITEQLWQALKPHCLTYTMGIITIPILQSHDEEEGGQNPKKAPGFPPPGIHALA